MYKVRNRNVKFIDGIYGRLEMISEILDTELDKVINASLLSGLSKYWIPICKVISKYPEGDTPYYPKKEPIFSDRMLKITKSDQSH
jgi:hypothetical protein